MKTINDVQLNEHCLKLKQHAEHLEMLMREGKAGMLWVALDQARHHAELGMYRILDIDKNADIRSS